MGIKAKIKEITAEVYEEGKKLPKPVWIAALVIPGGFDILAVYVIAKMIMKRKK